MSARRRSGARPAREDGFTLVEVLVAAVILAVGVLAALEVLIGSARSNFRAEQVQVATEQAQAELEKVRALDYGAIALTAVPGPTSAQGPGGRLSASCEAEGVSTNGCFAVSSEGTGSAPLVVEGGSLEQGGTVTGAAIPPGPTQFQSGDVEGTIHRYVVWQNDSRCSDSQCPGTQDIKRVVIVVELDSTGAAGQRPYREIQSDFIDPEAGQDVEPTPTPPQETTAQQFFLSDVSCDADDRPQPASYADHPVHNTTGRCADGPKTGTTPGAADLLALSSLDPAAPDSIFDYSTDIEPIAGDDSGLQLRRRTETGCVAMPSGPTAYEQVHYWVSPPVPGGTEFVLEGDATLRFWSRITNGVAASAKLCAVLFVRDEGVGGGFVDRRIGDADNFGLGYFSLSEESWPTEASETTLEMNLQPPDGDTNVRVLPGQRLGLALMVEKASTSTDLLQIDYDHPTFKSRLEVTTATPLGG